MAAPLAEDWSALARECADAAAARMHAVASSSGAEAAAELAEGSSDALKEEVESRAMAMGATGTKAAHTAAEAEAAFEGLMPAAVRAAWRAAHAARLLAEQAAAAEEPRARTNLRVLFHARIHKVHAKGRER